MNRPELQSILTRAGAEGRYIGNVENEFDRSLTFACGLASRVQQKMRSTCFWHKLDNAVARLSFGGKPEMRFVEPHHLIHAL